MVHGDGSRGALPQTASDACAELLCVCCDDGNGQARSSTNRDVCTTVATFRDERIVLRRPWYAELGDVVPDGIGCRDTNGSVECSMYCIYESTVDEAHDSVA